MKTTVATKFVNHEVGNLESLEGTPVYTLKLKVLNGDKLTRDEKNKIARDVNCNGHFRQSIPLMGWRFDFSDILKKYVVKQYGNHLQEYYAPDKTSLRAYLYGRIDYIVEVI